MGQEMERRGYKRKRATGGYRGFSDIALISKLPNNWSDTR